MIAQVISQSSSKCEISWVSIPQEHHRGVLLGYRIVYTFVNDALNTSNFTVGPAMTRYVPVQGLKPYTKYLLKVAGFTSKGDGNYSVPEECQTQEDSKFPILQLKNQCHPKRLHVPGYIFHNKKKHFLKKINHHLYTNFHGLSLMPLTACTDFRQL